MKTKLEREPKVEQHPFFHTMVVMGSALALGCGGISSGSEPERTNSGGSGGGGGGGSGGGGAGSGGSGSGGLGGTGSVGGAGGGAGTGAVISPSGGTSQGPVEPGPFECSPAQWDCSSNQPYCYSTGFLLPEACPCDSTRPASPSHCPEGEVMTCRDATHRDDGRPFSEPLPFECSCVPEQGDCELECDLAFPPDTGTCRYELEESGLRTVLCGCAVIVLR